jgi:hypothetical protein
MNDQILEKFPGSEQSFINSVEVQRFIIDRGIKPEDFPVIEKLATFSRNFLISHLHNFFSFAREEGLQRIA